MVRWSDGGTSKTKVVVGVAGTPIDRVTIRVLGGRCHDGKTRWSFEIASGWERGTIAVSSRAVYSSKAEACRSAEHMAAALLACPVPEFSFFKLKLSSTYGKPQQERPSPSRRTKKEKKA